MWFLSLFYSHQGPQFVRRRSTVGSAAVNELPQFLLLGRYIQYRSLCPILVKEMHMGKTVGDSLVSVKRHLQSSEIAFSPFWLPIPKCECAPGNWGVNQVDLVLWFVWGLRSGSWGFEIGLLHWITGDLFGSPEPIGIILAQRSRTPSLINNYMHWN